MLYRFPFALLLIVLLALPFTAGCRQGNGILTPTSSFDAGSVSSDRAVVGKLIMQGCVDAGWRPTNVGDNTIEARIVVRGKHTVVVDIPYTLAGYKIVYKDSVNMEYNPDSNAGVVIHPNYNNWVVRLDQCIRKRVMMKSIG